MIIDQGKAEVDKSFLKGEHSYYYPLGNEVFVLLYQNYYQAKNIT